jgi:hypothetical protein
MFSLQAKTGNGAQALALKVSAEAPPLGMVGDFVSFSGCLSTKGNAIIQGVDVSSVYRYAQTYQLHGLAGYLRAEQPGYWGLLTSAQLAGLCRELGQQLYTDCRAIADWLAAIYGVRYSVSGLTDVLHRLGPNALSHFPIN